MTGELPEIDNLLETALTTLRNELLPQLPEQARYTGLMVANALSIALRELRGETERSAMADAIKDLVGSTDVTALCSAIEAGAFDETSRDIVLRQALMLITRARLSINNPKMLG